MQLEAIRKNGHFYIPYLDRVKVKSDKIMIEIDNDIIENKNDKKIEYSDEYLQKNWRKLIMTSSLPVDYEDSEEYKKDRGEYLAKKYQ
ncbi:MAG: hypothetical protein DRQ51_01730 [Gammaproteobacteria bacterium]|nr:MAG: hypothetical protein DRQ51_01730 [Gammaproteobacteria bacterium]